MPDVREDPDDAVVVFRGTRLGDLAAARAALDAAAIPTLAVWRPTAAPAGLEQGGALPDTGEGLLRVPRDRADEARRLLVEEERVQAARIRAHLDHLPTDLRRFGLLLLPAALGAQILMGEPPAWLVLGLCAAIALLAALEVRARRRRLAAADEPALPPRVPDWFVSDPEPRPRRPG